jgi:hypothetical protein
MYNLKTYGSEGNGVGGCGLDSFGTGQGQVASSCEHGNEPSGSGYFLTS